MADAEYDFCLSYAGRHRGYVKRVTVALKNAGLRVFYDRDELGKLAGENLQTRLGEIYQNARHCVAFLSAAYARSMWTQWELEVAQSRAFTDRNYLLYGRFDNTKFPAVLGTTQYTDLNVYSSEQFAEILIKKFDDTIQLPPPTWRRRLSDFRWRHRIALRIAGIAAIGALVFALSTAVLKPSATFAGATDNVIAARVAARWRPLQITSCTLTFDSTLPIEPAELKPVNADVKRGVVEPLRTERIAFKLVNGELLLKEGVTEEQIKDAIAHGRATITITAKDGETILERSDTFPAEQIHSFIDKWVADYVP